MRKRAFRKFPHSITFEHSLNRKSCDTLSVEISFTNYAPNVKQICQQLIPKMCGCRDFIVCDKKVLIVCKPIEVSKFL